jgi:hypothetical protein
LAIVVLLNSLASSATSITARRSFSAEKIGENKKTNEIISKIRFIIINLAIKTTVKNLKTDYTLNFLTLQI